MKRILVRRAGAFGDVICVTPVMRRLRNENPDDEIDVDTQYPDVFLNNPHRIGFMRDVAYDRVIDLDMAFERNLRRVGIVESYMEVAFGDRRGSTCLEMSYGPPPEFGLDGPLPLQCISRDHGRNARCRSISGLILPISWQSVAGSSSVSERAKIGGLVATECLIYAIGSICKCKQP